MLGICPALLVTGGRIWDAGAKVEVLKHWTGRWP
jgi:hypothetical protein